MIIETKSNILLLYEVQRTYI